MAGELGGIRSRAQYWEPEEVFRDGEVVNDIFQHYEQTHPRMEKRRLTGSQQQKKRKPLKNSKPHFFLKRKKLFEFLNLLIKFFFTTCVVPGTMDHS